MTARHRPGTFDPDWCISPGETLRDWMEENKMSPRVVAVTCQLPLTDIEGLLSGKRRLTRKIAGYLESGTFIPARLWLNLERTYRQGLATGKHDMSRAEE